MIDVLMSEIENGYGDKWDTMKVTVTVELYKEVAFIKELIEDAGKGAIKNYTWILQMLDRLARLMHENIVILSKQRIRLGIHASLLANKKAIWVLREFKDLIIKMEEWEICQASGEQVD